MACISLCWPNGTRTDSGIGGNAPILRTRVCLSEEPIHDGCAGLDDGPDLVPVDQLDDVVSLCPTSREMSSRETPASDSSETNERRSSRGVQSAGSSRGPGGGAAQIATDIGGVHALARAGREHEASLGPLLPGASRSFAFCTRSARRS